MLIPFDRLFAKYDLVFSGVLHIGANTGEERGVYDDLGIEKQIWIEGNPEIFPQLKQNISHNRRAIALNYVIGDENRNTVLHISNNDSQSSSVLELGAHMEQHPDVHYVKDISCPMRRVDKLGLDLAEVDLLNVDVQGFELQVLEGMGDLLEGFKAAYLEVNRADVYKGCAQVESIDAFMSANGFERMETRWMGIWGDAFYIRSARRAG